MFKINPSELRNPITIERATKKKDNNNIPVDKWEVLLNTKAKIINVRGNEVKIGNGNTAIIEKSFYIRYSRQFKLTEEDRIIFDNKTFNISYTNNVDEAGIWLEIRGVAIE